MDSTPQTPTTPLDVYNRGVEDFRHEQQEREYARTSPSPAKQMSQNGSPAGRTRSRSPIHRRSRSRSPRRNNRGMNNRSNNRSSNRAIRDKSHRCYISNLNYETRWMNLKDFMKKIGTVEHVEVFTDGEGRSKGCGVVEYENKEDAEKAIKELDGQELGGRKVRVREDTMDEDTYKRQLETQKEKTKNLRDRDQQMRDGGGRGGPPPPQQAMGLAPGLGALAGGLGGLGGGLGGLGGGLGGLGALLNLQNTQLQILTFLNSKGADQINTSVFVSNLDYEVNWQKLKDMFRRVGVCNRVDIAQDNDSRSKGFGSVVFETPMEAINAVASFNGYETGPSRRAMAVRLDRSSQIHKVLSTLGINSNEITQHTIVQLQQLAAQAVAGANTLGSLGGALGGAGGGGASSQGSALGALSSLVGSGGGGYSQGGGQSNQGGGLSGLANSLSGLSALLGNAGGLSGLSGLSGGGNNMSGGSGGRDSYRDHRDSRRDDSRRDSYGSRDRGGGSERNSGGGCRIFIRNLPYSVKWQDLKDKFRDAGKVVRAEIQLNDQGKSRGQGLVTFENRADADRAVDLFNGTRIDGREMMVKIDQMQ